jgi:hypothetical protein
VVGGADDAVGADLDIDRHAIDDDVEETVEVWRRGTAGGGNITRFVTVR